MKEHRTDRSTQDVQETDITDIWYHRSMELENELPSEPYPSALDRQTLAEDQRHAFEISNRKPTVFFRPGDRSNPSHAGYWASNADRISFIRVITQYGNHEEGRRPRFLSTVLPVRVLLREVKALKRCGADECARAYVELSSAHAVLEWLRQKYPMYELTLESLVTVYTVAYTECRSVAHKREEVGGM